MHYYFRTEQVFYENNNDWVNTYGLIMPYRSDLSTKHDGGKECEQKSLEHEEQEEYDGCWRWVRRTSVPVWSHAAYKVVDGQEQGMEGHQCDVELKTGDEIWNAIARNECSRKFQKV